MADSDIPVIVTDLASRVAALEAKASPSDGVVIAGIDDVGGFLSHIFTTWFGSETAAWSQSEQLAKARIDAAKNPPA